MTTADRALISLPPAGEPGVTARAIAEKWNLAHVAVACALRRLWWGGRVDRVRIAGAYRYTLRPEAPMITYRWKIEMQASTHPVEEWVEMRDAERGRRLRYVERSEAEHDLALLRKRQPHAEMRVRPC